MLRYWLVALLRTLYSVEASSAQHCCLYFFHLRAVDSGCLEPPCVSQSVCSAEQETPCWTVEASSASHPPSKHSYITPKPFCLRTSLFKKIKFKNVCAILTGLQHMSKPQNHFTSFSPFSHLFFLMRLQFSLDVKAIPYCPFPGEGYCFSYAYKCIYLHVYSFVLPFGPV